VNPLLLIDVDVNDGNIGSSSILTLHCLRGYNRTIICSPLKTMTYQILKVTIDDWDSLSSSLPQSSFVIEELIVQFDQLLLELNPSDVPLALASIEQFMTHITLGRRCLNLKKVTVVSNLTSSYYNDHDEYDSSKSGDEESRHQAHWDVFEYLLQQLTGVLKSHVMSVENVVLDFRLMDDTGLFIIPEFGQPITHDFILLASIKLHMLTCFFASILSLQMMQSLQVILRGNCPIFPAALGLAASSSTICSETLEEIDIRFGEVYVYTSIHNNDGRRHGQEGSIWADELGDPATQLLKWMQERNLSHNAKIIISFPGGSFSRGDMRHLLIHGSDNCDDQLGIWCASKSIKVLLSGSDSFSSMLTRRDAVRFNAEYHPPIVCPDVFPREEPWNGDGHPTSIGGSEVESEALDDSSLVPCGRSASSEHNLDPTSESCVDVDYFLSAVYLTATGGQANINLRNNTGETTAGNGDSAAKTEKGSKREEVHVYDCVVAEKKYAEKFPKTNTAKNSTNSEEENAVLAMRNDSPDEGSGYGERGASDDNWAGGKCPDARGINITKARAGDDEKQEAVEGGTNDIALSIDWEFLQPQFDEVKGPLANSDDESLLADETEEDDCDISVMDVDSVLSEPPPSEFCASTSVLFNVLSRFLFEHDASSGGGNGQHHYPGIGGDTHIIPMWPLNIDNVLVLTLLRFSIHKLSLVKFYDLLSDRHMKRDAVDTVEFIVTVPSRWNRPPNDVVNLVERHLTKAMEQLSSLLCVTFCPPGGLFPSYPESQIPKPITLPSPKLNLPYLTVLRLEGLGLDDTELHLMAPCVGALKIEELSLAGNKITVAGLRSFFREMSLLFTTGITTLDLHQNQFEFLQDSDAEVVFPSGLHHANLADNTSHPQISLSLLGHNRALNLVSVDISRSPNNTTSIQPLITLLDGSSRIEHIDVRGFSFQELEEPMVDNLTLALRNCRSIISCIFDGRALSYNAWSSLVFAVRGGTALQTISSNHSLQKLTVKSQESWLPLPLLHGLDMNSKKWTEIKEDWTRQIIVSKIVRDGTPHHEGLVSLIAEAVQERNGLKPHFWAAIATSNMGLLYEVIRATK